MMPRYRLIALPQGSKSLDFVIDLGYPFHIFALEAKRLRLFGPREDAPEDATQAFKVRLPAAIDLVRLGQGVASGTLDALIDEAVAAGLDGDYARVMAAEAGLKAVFDDYLYETLRDMQERYCPDLAARE